MKPVRNARPGLDDEIFIVILTARRPPTIREIGRAVHAVPSIVYYHLLTLERRGFITWDRVVARGIRARKRYWKIPPDKLQNLRSPGMPLGADAAWYDGRTGQIVFTFNGEEPE